MGGSRFGELTARPAPRDYHFNVGGDESMPLEPREAWSQLRGNGAPMAVAKGVGSSSTATALLEDNVKLVLYTPPCSIEELARKLQVSVVMGPTARVAQGGFISRYLLNVHKLINIFTRFRLR